MNHTRVFSLLFFFASAALSQTVYFSSQPVQASCPIELTASWDGTFKLLPVTPRGKGRSTSDERRLQITLRNPKAEVASARVTVHGFPVEARLQPAVLYFSSDPAEITKTIALDLLVAVGQSARFDLPLARFGTVTSIDLDSLTYADGLIWRPERHSACRAVGVPVDIVGGPRTHSADPR